MKAVNKSDNSEDLESVSVLINDDIDTSLLKVQLQTMSINFQASTTCSFTSGRSHDFKDFKDYMSNLTSAQAQLFSEVAKLYKFILLAPATNAVSERSCSALRQTKTWLRTTMSQERLNHCLILHVHKGLTDDINLVSLANYFVSANEPQLRLFGHFST